MSDIREPDLSEELEEMRVRNAIAVTELEAVRRRLRDRQARRETPADLPVFPIPPDPAA